MREEAIVELVEGDEVTVSLKRLPACLGCRKHNCSDANDLYIKTKTAGSFRKGEKVRVALDGTFVVKAVIFVYVIPLLAFIAGTICAYRYIMALGIGGPVEFLAVITGIFFMGCAFLIARNFGLNHKTSCRVKISAIEKEKKV